MQLSVPAFPQQTFSGAVRSIAPTVDSKSRTAAVRIEPNDGASRLRAGMFAQLSIVTAEKQNALIVPKQAVLVGIPGTEPLVITIAPDGRVHRQPVRLGLQSDTADEILAGIDDGQLVATSSLSDLTDGDIVAPVVDTRIALARYFGEGLRAAADWIEDYRRFWEQQFDKLEAFLKRTAPAPAPNPPKGKRHGRRR